MEMATVAATSPTTSIPGEPSGPVMGPDAQGPGGETARLSSPGTWSSEMWRETLGAEQAEGAGMDLGSHPARAWAPDAHVPTGEIVLWSNCVYAGGRWMSHDGAGNVYLWSHGSHEQGIWVHAFGPGTGAPGTSQANTRPRTPAERARAGAFRRLTGCGLN